MANELEKSIMDIYKNDVSHQDNLCKKIKLYKEQNIETQIDSGEKGIIDMDYLHFLRDVCFTTFINYEDDLNKGNENLEKEKNLREYYQKICEEYEKKHGKLNPEFYKSISKPSTSLQFSSSQKVNSIQNRLKQSTRNLLKIKDNK